MFNRKTRILDEPSHNELVDWIVPWNDERHRSVRHDDMTTFSNDPVTGFLKGTNGAFVAYPRKFRQPSRPEPCARKTPKGSRTLSERKGSRQLLLEYSEERLLLSCLETNNLAKRGTKLRTRFLQHRKAI